MARNSATFFATALAAVSLALPATLGFAQAASPSPTVVPAVEGHRDTPLLPGNK